MLYVYGNHKSSLIISKQYLVGVHDWASTEARKKEPDDFKPGQAQLQLHPL